MEKRIKRLGQIYVDGVIPEGDYRYQKRTLELELGSLVMPEVDAMKEAAKLLQDLPKLWEEATVDERRRLLMAMLDAVYVDTKVNRRIVGIRPKPPFQPMFLLGGTNAGLTTSGYSPHSTWSPRGSTKPTSVG